MLITNKNILFFITTYNKNTQTYKDQLNLTHKKQLLITFCFCLGEVAPSDSVLLLQVGHDL